MSASTPQRPIPDEIKAMVTSTRAAQGLPLKIEDPETLARLVEIFGRDQVGVEPLKAAA